MLCTIHTLHHVLGVYAVQLPVQINVLEATAESRGSYGVFPPKLSVLDGLQRSILNKNKCLQ